MLCYLGQQYREYFILLCRVPNLTTLVNQEARCCSICFHSNSKLVLPWVVLKGISLVCPPPDPAHAHLAVQEKYLSLLIFQLLTHCSWRERGMHSWRRTRTSFSGNICQLYSFSWLENCTVSKETRFCHWQRHASPLGRPEYLPC